MATREEHLQWCKARALEYVKQGDLPNAVTSMLMDLHKWEGGAMYDQELLAILSYDGMMFCRTPPDVTRWIEGFN